MRQLILHTPQIQYPNRDTAQALCVSRVPMYILQSSDPVRKISCMQTKQDSEDADGIVVSSHMAQTTRSIHRMPSFSISSTVVTWTAWRPVLQAPMKGAANAKTA